MNTQIFTENNFMDMDPMHDCTASKISIEDNILVVTYEGLDEDLQNPDGTPCYKSKNLTVRYEFGWRCDARIFKKRTYKIIDLIREADMFYKLIRDCQFESYAYSVNSFKEIRLFFIFKNSSNEDLEIIMDAKKIVYNWN